jgi:hypothetical protein
MLKEVAKACLELVILASELIGFGKFLKRGDEGFGDKGSSVGAEIATCVG